jgi:hypothetical protein
VVHIIPAAFDYFDDIKTRAFSWVDEMSKYDLELEVLTIQYSTDKNNSDASDKIKSDRRKFAGVISGQAGMANLSQFDLVHVHCPMLGGAGDLLKWIKSESRPPLICTYHPAIKFPGIFGWLIRGYNQYYLPKIFVQADIVTVYSDQAGCQQIARRYGVNGDSWLGLDDGQKNALTNHEVVLKLLAVYSQVVSKLI